MERAAGPLPSTMSMRKSSMAGYSTSSTGRGRRWISSMNRTSPDSSLVSMAARSPARSRAGPDVVWRWASTSLATMCARVVLPRPGGPANNRWSTGSRRLRAAPRSTSRWPFNSLWPTNSGRLRGRRAASPRRSAGSGSGDSSSAPSSSGTPAAAATAECSPDGGASVSERVMPAASPLGHSGGRTGQPPQRLAQQQPGVVACGQFSQHAPDLLSAVAQPVKSHPHIGSGLVLRLGNGC